MNRGDYAHYPLDVGRRVNAPPRESAARDAGCYRRDGRSVPDLHRGNHRPRSFWRRGQDLFDRPDDHCWWTRCGRWRAVPAARRGRRRGTHDAPRPQLLDDLRWWLLNRARAVLSATTPVLPLVPRNQPRPRAVSVLTTGRWRDDWQPMSGTSRSSSS